ncbi:MAG: GTP cyclohydrolase I FolE [Candidatus Hydrogenedentota bacterium]
MDKDRVERLMKELLEAIDEDPSRGGLEKTPLRVANSWEFLTSGYRSNIDEIINDAIFESESNNMIISRDIEVYSLCEHHLLPFYGRCHIGYVADKKVLGLSKLARIVDHYARRLQIQERLTGEIAQEIMDVTEADGVGVVIECRHLCSMMRGVEKQNSVMTTSSVLGSFRSDQATRNEFLKLISRSV